MARDRCRAAPRAAPTGQLRPRRERSRRRVRRSGSSPSRPRHGSPDPVATMAVAADDVRVDSGWFCVAGNRRPPGHTLKAGGRRSKTGPYGRGASRVAGHRLGTARPRHATQYHGVRTSSCSSVAHSMWMPEPAAPAGSRLDVSHAVGFCTPRRDAVRDSTAADGVRLRVREGRVEWHARTGGFEQSGSRRTALDRGRRRGRAPAHAGLWRGLGLGRGHRTCHRDRRPSRSPGFLAWAGRELGREITYSTPATAVDAAGIVVHGSIAGLTPAQALDAVLATTRMHAVRCRWAQNCGKRRARPAVDGCDPMIHTDSPQTRANAQGANGSPRLRTFSPARSAARTRARTQRPRCNGCGARFGMDDGIAHARRTRHLRRPGARRSRVEQSDAYQAEYQTVEKAAAYNHGYQRNASTSDSARATNSDDRPRTCDAGRPFARDPGAALRRRPHDAAFAGHRGLRHRGGHRDRPDPVRPRDVDPCDAARLDDRVRLPHSAARRRVDGTICIRLAHHLPTHAERDRLFQELMRVSRRFVIVTYFDHTRSRT